jgi:recombination endonuclease VII
MVTSEGRVCTKCGIFKPWADFHAMRMHGSGHYPRCKTCRQVHANYLHPSLPADELSRRRRLLMERTRKHRFGITPEDFQAMVDAQDGRCALCRQIPKPPKGHGTPFVVDHDHVTRQVRGLLCSPCNKGLGNFEDDPARLVAAADYLMNPPQVHLGFRASDYAVAQQTAQTMRRRSS